MSADNSPMYAAGTLDAINDALRVGSCPPQPTLGPLPPNPDYPVMYMRGYASVPQIPHECTEKCRKDGQR